jgi:hypothetical protein
MSNGRLTVALEPRDLPADGVFATEVINTGMPHALTMSMSPGTPQTVSVPPGVYLVRASLPSGELLTGTAEVAADTDAEVTVGVPRGEGRRTKGAGGPPVTVWARLWRGAAPTAWPTDAREEWTPAGGRVIYLPTGLGLHALQVGGRDIAWRVVCLPPSDSCRITFVRVPPAEDFEEGLRVRAWGADPEVESVLRYLVAGQLDHAMALMDKLAGGADAPSPSYRSLEAAVVIGYVLLKSRGTAGLREWASTVGAGDEWLPDLHVIHAWRLLRERTASQRRLARERLLAAADAGVPRYTEGLRLLFEGLRLVEASDPGDTAVRSAVADVRPYAQACDWASPQTTYWGSGPAAPDLTRRAGDPEDSRDVADLRVGR